ncbi:hypothetical protein LBMAG42_40220 [Deltaproteobacteria bacterium]|nr:hypothetical protein LBMAG42_40220 [Deltaproteobacteria bacterium]
MTAFRPLNPRGAFVPSSPLGTPERAFAPMSPARAATFTAGFNVRAAAAFPAPVAREAAPKVERAPAVEIAPRVEAAPAPVATAQPEKPLAVHAAMQEAEATIAAFAERERVRAEEHAQILADLELQKAKTKANNERLGQLAGELVRMREAMVAEVREHVGAMLLLGARRLAGESLRGEPGLLEALVRHTVDGLGGGAVVVRVNPADAERLTGVLGDDVRVVGDTSIHAGCIAQGEHGTIEATVDVAAGSLLAEVQAWKRTA